ncbi:MAG: helix-turn-helix domain-containing protein [Chloroflexota bacterium]
MVRLFEQARATVNDRLLRLSEEEVNELKGLTIGGRIKWLLTYLEANYPGGYSIHKVALRTGVITPQGLWAIIRDETKNPSAKVIAALADELGVPLRFLLIGEVPVQEAANIAWMASLPEDLQAFVSEQKHLPYLRAACEVAHAASVQDLPPEALRQFIELWMAVSQRADNLADRDDSND